MLTDDQAIEAATHLHKVHGDELPHLDRFHDFARGLRGVPDVPEGASDEVKELARLSVKNVISVVVDTFASNLLVIGYRRRDAEANGPAWATWQRNRMDARQAEAHRAALTYGLSYVRVLPSERGALMQPRSPRQLCAMYADPQVDEWPVYALESWVDHSGSRPHRYARLYDAEASYLLDLGEATRTYRTKRLSNPEVVDSERHDAGVCPVVRFVNRRDSEDHAVGEVEPLIRPQLSLNAVNFDRLVVSRFGAFPQKWVIGWDASREQVLKASASQLWAFVDDNVKAGQFTAASVDPYNAVLEEMQQHIAMIAQISPAQITGKMVNLSAEALAFSEAHQQRKLHEKRASFGESWEQVLRLASALEGDADSAGDDGAEVQWRDTEARSFAAVVDGTVKLAQQYPEARDVLFDLVPGMTQQQVAAVRQRIANAAPVEGDPAA